MKKYSRRGSPSSFYLPLLIAVCVFGCSPKNIDPPEESEPAKSEAAIPVPDPAPAPGTATVNAIVSACTESENAFVCTFSITELISSGSATPSLIVGRALIVLVPKSLDSAASTGLDGGNVSATLRHLTLREGATTPAWTAVVLTPSDS